MADVAQVDLPTGVRTESEIVTLQSGAEVQVCRTSVHRVHKASVDVVLLLDTFGRVLATPADLQQFAYLASSNGIIAGLLSAHSGEATVITQAAGEVEAEDVAFAAAVCCASWGWDESDRIRVDLNGQSRVVAPRFREGRWTAQRVDSPASIRTQSVRG